MILCESLPEAGGPRSPLISDVNALLFQRHSLFIFSANGYEEPNTDCSNRSNHAECRKGVVIDGNRSVLIDRDFKAIACSSNTITIQICLV